MRVVQAVYDSFRELSTWPKFGEIDRQLRRSRRPLDAGRVVQDIPDTVLQPLGGPPSASTDYPMRLTLEGVAQCKRSEDDVDLFLRALRWMATRERRFVPAAGADTTMAAADSQQFMRAMKIQRTRMNDVQRLGRLLMVERWGWLSGGSGQDGTWNFTITRDVHRFGKVKTIDDYREAKERWAAETVVRPQPMLTQIEATENPNDTSTSTGNYVDPRIVAMIEEKQAISAWKCDKLIQLILELNDNYSRDNPNCAHAALRALLDHVAPLFGYTDFTRVVDNCSWGTTDRKYMKQLANFKAQADDALHRQISRQKMLLLVMDDLPAKRAVNRLLETCVERL